MCNSPQTYGSEANKNTEKHGESQTHSINKQVHPNRPWSNINDITVAHQPLLVAARKIEFQICRPFFLKYNFKK
jgi:hypothetical protein